MTAASSKAAPEISDVIERPDELHVQARHLLSVM
jgi:hypothetical protein